MRASPMDILARKSVRRTSRRAERAASAGAVGPPCAAAGQRADCHARRTRRLPREDPRAEVGEDIGVRVGSVEFSYYQSGAKCN